MQGAADAEQARTYVPDDIGRVEAAGVFAELEHQFRSGGTMALVSAEGERIELPGRMFVILRQIAETLAAGRGVTVVPRDTQLTTQEAADFLGISRPTLVKLLTEDKIPFTTVGRHRRVTLEDLLDYQARSQAGRRAVLRQMARGGQEAGMLDVVYEPGDEG